MKIVGTDAGEVERALLAGELACPDCAGQLRPWGSARWRDVRRWEQVQRRRPRRSRCGGCQTTHVLISTDSLLRRRDLAEAIGAALVAKAAGQGYRRAAVAAGAPVSTTRRWLRRFADIAEAIRVWFTVLAHDLDPLLAPILATPTAFGDAVEAVAVAARAATLRLATVEPWAFASKASRGRLISNARWPWASAV